VGELITDLVQIELLGEKKRDENFKFRSFMKSRDHSDRILRRIAEGIQERIDCTQCANCCKTSTTEVTGRDIEKLARNLHTTPERFHCRLHDARRRRRADDARPEIPAKPPAASSGRQPLLGVRRAPSASASTIRTWFAANGSIASRMLAVRRSRLGLAHPFYNCLESFQGRIAVPEVGRAIAFRGLFAARRGQRTTDDKTRSSVLPTAGIR